MTQGIDPETHFSKVLYTKHQAIETQVALPGSSTPAPTTTATATR